MRQITSQKYCAILKVLVSVKSFANTDANEANIPDNKEYGINEDLVMSTLSRVVLGKDIPTLPFNIAEKVDAYEGVSIWSLYQGTKKEDGSPVSIFTFDCTKQKDKLPLAKNAFKKFRTIRHPDLLRYVDGVETDSNIYIVTENVTPLITQINVRPDDNLVSWGLYKVGSALKFLNNDCSMIHGNVRISSIFTNKAGEWKLAGFELMSSPKEDNPVIFTYGGLVVDSSKYASPEIAKNSWNNLKEHDVWVTDSWNYGTLIYEVYNGAFSSTNQLENTGAIPQNILSPYKQLIRANPKSRLKISAFVDACLRPGGFFQNDLVQINLFLENMNIKEAREKDIFFKKLIDTIDKMPGNICKYKILPELLKALEFGSVLPSIIKIGETLDDNEYEQFIVTSIIKMFAVPDRAMRLSLLENLGSFIDHLDNKTVNEKATGFTDTAPIIRESTVKSVLLLAPKLTERVINNDLLRHLAKLQMDEMPGIRTNTTICLGKISKYLSDSTKKKILVTAFTRALRDPFPHARAASLMALTATLEYYDATDCATRILPCVSVVLVDKEKPVRIQAFKSLDVIVKRLEKLVESMPDSAILTEQSSGNADTSLPTSVAGSVVSAAESWTGWAVTSLTKKITGVNVEGEIAAAPTDNTNSDTSAHAHEKSGSEYLSPSPSSSDSKCEALEKSGSEYLSPSPSSSGSKLHPTDGWELDDFEWGNNDGWDDDWDTSRPSPATSTRSVSPIQKSTPSITVSKEERAAELNKKREERRQRMSMLKEKKKKSSVLGAKKI
ncbi:2855_t:CDS:10 [Dentiscutata heterogama]|uniref:2855_t:CDS:1 n=1 Tax=Dentiscutata heterogama TaxID=1316150 RepID=A0ACA9K0B1_9GLOM|nr:2855_t:CDS:10 [Dentiscutata heterogama]